MEKVPILGPVMPRLSCDVCAVKRPRAPYHSLTTRKRNPLLVGECINSEKDHYASNIRPQIQIDTSVKLATIRSIRVARWFGTVLKFVYLLSRVWQLHCAACGLSVSEVCGNHLAFSSGWVLHHRFACCASSANDAGTGYGHRLGREAKLEPQRESWN